MADPAPHPDDLDPWEEIDIGEYALDNPEADAEPFDEATYADRFPPPADTREVDRMLREYRRHAATVADVDERFTHLMEALGAWRDFRVSGAQQRMMYLAGAINKWAESNKIPSYDSPFGKVTSRAGRNSVELTREGEFCKWALENERPDLIKFAASKSAIKDGPLVANFDLAGEVPQETDLVDPDTGELVPGVKLVNPGRKWSVKP